MSCGALHVRLDARASGAVAYLTVDNRTKLNSLDRALMSEFIAVIDSLAAREDLRALVLTGAGERAFIGGADVSEMAELDRDCAEDFIKLVHRSCDCLRSLPVPAIARIDGYALGAGLAHLSRLASFPGNFCGAPTQKRESSQRRLSANRL